MYCLWFYYRNGNFGNSKKKKLCLCEYIIYISEVGFNKLKTFVQPQITYIMTQLI